MAVPLFCYIRSLIYSGLVWHLWQRKSGNDFMPSWQPGVPHPSPCMFLRIDISFAPLLSIKIAGWQSAHLLASSCSVCGNMTGPVPAFFMLSTLLSNVISPSPAIAVTGMIMTAAVRTIAIRRLRISNKFIEQPDYFFFGDVWHLVQSVSGKATLPWHLPHHSPSAIPAMVMWFSPLAGMNILGWHTSHLSHQV